MITEKVTKYIFEGRLLGKMDILGTPHLCLVESDEEAESSHITGVRLDVKILNAIQDTTPPGRYVRITVETLEGIE